MNHIWNGFDNSVREMFRFTSGKTVVLWGYGWGGWFVEHLFKKNNKKIEYIVDDNDKIRVNSSYIIRSLDINSTVILITCLRDERISEYLEKLGYGEGDNFYYVKKWFNMENSKESLSYLHYLEENFKLDISENNEKYDTIETNEYHEYASSRDYSLIDVLDNFEISSQDSIFDFGCGKGGALIIFHRAGFQKYGGVEYSKNIYIY